MESIRSSQQAKYETSGVNFAVYSSLLHLTQDFIHCATSYGKIIMEEAHLPKEMKTISPQQIGGIAGGEKYIVRGILFKFAIDEKGLFDDPAAAAKVAGHDLKGLNCYVNCNIEGLCYPLMALLDYRGQRLIAISLIPIDNSTLVYGTADASRMDRVNHETTSGSREEGLTVASSSQDMGPRPREPSPPIIGRGLPSRPRCNA